MSATPRAFSATSIALHWLVAVGILGMIGFLMLTYLLAGGFLSVARPGAIEMPRFASLGVGSGLTWMDADAAWIGYKASWWLHALVVLAFLNYLPY